MTKEEKLVVINSLAEQLQTYPHFYIADIEALNAAQTAALRRKCFESDVKLVVVKNTLLTKALEKVEKADADLVKVLEGPTSIMFANVAKAPAVLIKEFQCYYLGSGFPEFTNAYKGNEIQLRRIRRVTDYIYRNYNKPIKIEDLAGMEHISANYLSSILKNGCGVGFRTFLNLARVEKSAAMLLDTNKSLQTIAYECGFSKYSYFCESFQRSFTLRGSPS